jgi:hypothetical protein
LLLWLLTQQQLGYQQQQQQWQEQTQTQHQLE